MNPILHTSTLVFESAKLPRDWFRICFWRLWFRGSGGVLANSVAKLLSSWV